MSKREVKGSRSRSTGQKEEMKMNEGEADQRTEGRKTGREIKEDGQEWRQKLEERQENGGGESDVKGIVCMFYSLAC